jgi:hypothetical protein
MERLMNDTKWRELCAAMAARNPRPRWTSLSENGHTHGPEREWHHHLRAGGFHDLVHVDILPDTATEREEILAVLRAIHVPGEVRSDRLRVIGLAPPGTPVDWI